MTESDFNKKVAYMELPDFDETTGKAGSIRYIGRKKSASPAAGHLKVHTKEQEELFKEIGHACIR